jgi:hypothetical protein
VILANIKDSYLPNRQKGNESELMLKILILKKQFKAKEDVSL